MRLPIAVLALFVAVYGSAPCVGQTPYPSHRIDAHALARGNYDAMHEERRRFLVQRQRWLNDEMVLWSNSFPAWRYYAEPWPFLPGDIYGYPVNDFVISQPVDRIEQQVGPNTWVSRPVYAEDFAVPVEIDDFPAEEIIEESWLPRGPREF